MAATVDLLWQHVENRCLALPTCSFSLFWGAVKGCPPPLDGPIPPPGCREAWSGLTGGSLSGRAFHWSQLSRPGCAPGIPQPPCLPLAGLWTASPGPGIHRAPWLLLFLSTPAPRSPVILLYLGACFQGAHSRTRSSPSSTLLRRPPTGPQQYLNHQIPRSLRHLGSFYLTLDHFFPPVHSFSSCFRESALPSSSSYLSKCFSLWVLVLTQVSLSVTLLLCTFSWEISSIPLALVPILIVKPSESKYLTPISALNFKNALGIVP